MPIGLKVDRSIPKSQACPNITKFKRLWLFISRFFCFFLQWFVCFSLVIRKPVRQTSLFKFMTVLRVEVWLSIVGAIITTSIMLWLLDKYSPYSAKNNKEAYPYPCR